MSNQELIIEGARQNNLKNISLTIPHNKVVAVTGVSGSGKSSLAFDTIFAEGQWRFIESLSSYARLFLEKLNRPEVDAISNIRPAIALEQKNPVRGSRSTVGTLTELYDLFRVLYAKIATPYCPQCGREIRKWDPSQIVSELLLKYSGRKAILLFDSNDGPLELMKAGLHRIWKDGEISELSHGDLLDDGTLTVVLDRLVITDNSRLSDSIENAWKLGNGCMTVLIIGDKLSAVSSQQGEADAVSDEHADNNIILKFSADNMCESCNISLPEPSPVLFSFNHPVGACPSCRGFGDLLQYDEDLIVPDKKLSLSAGAIDPWNKPAAKWWKKQLMTKGEKAGLDLRKPYDELSEKERDILFKGTKGFYGINDFFDDLEGRRYKLHVRVFLSRYRRSSTCHVCSGKRLSSNVLAYKISGLDISELSAMSVGHLYRFFSEIDLAPFKRSMAAELLRQIMLKIQFLEKVGLSYLALNRYGKTLSGGEYQRINLSNQLSSLLTGTLYVLDEPTIGLHPRDTVRILEILRALAELGNTIIVVEHDRSIIESSEWIIELGPGGGHKGGNIVYSGPISGFLKADTLTSRYIKDKGKHEVLPKRRSFSGDMIELSGAAGNNLRNVSVGFPLGRMTAVTGVSGSGKSSLVVGTLYRALGRHFKTEQEPPLRFEGLKGSDLLKGARLIDQSPIGRSPRSNPATYMKIFDHIRKIFAEQRESRAHGYGPGFFSFNLSGGRCEACKGGGVELMEMFFFEDLYITCEKCEGRRYKDEALRVTYKDRNINDVLNMTVEEAYSFFSDFPPIKSRLELLIETGLGYLRLGQPATTLSGGEAQRLKICAELQKKGIKDDAASGRRTGALITNPGYLYILDEPTVGLHFEDVKALLLVLNRLVEAGNTIIVIEHNLDIIRAADWIIDMGPEGGDKGGAVVFEGRPEDIVSCRESHTGEYLVRGV